MGVDRFFIAPYDRSSGLQNDVKPWLIPDQAFSNLKNMYSFRGRMRKRVGSRWLGNTQQSTRLRMSAGTLNAPAALPASVIPAIGQMFSIADVLFTVNVLGTPMTLLVSNGSATTATFDTTSRAFVFAGVKDANGVNVPGATTIFFYPSLPVMGLLTYEQDVVNDELTIAFDTKYSYSYISGNGWDRITGETNAGDSVWTGSNSQFFWGTNYGGVDPSIQTLYVTNSNQNEPNHMRFLQSPGGVLTWTTFYPQVQAAPIVIHLATAQILVTFKNRMIAMNIWEAQDPGPTLVHYPFRIRWCAQAADPNAVDAWRSDIPGKGGGLDLPINQAIITAEFVKDRLIIYCEQSTWELVYTNNQVYPFTFQQINTELGAESTFSIVPFDKVALGIAQNGIHACTGTNVERIDSDIPDQVWGIHNANDGAARVYGIRDFFVEMVYWTFPSADASTAQPYPNRMLVYNYKNNTWSFNDDSITAFGYYFPQTGVTWDSETVKWDDDVSWSEVDSQEFKQEVIAGNQEGWTFIMDADITENAPALQISDITVTGATTTFTAIDHNLRIGDFIYLEGISGSGTMTLLNNTILKIITSPTQNTFSFNDLSVTGTYAGGGTIQRVSKPEMDTKQFNFYVKEGRNASIFEVDFQVDATQVGQLTIDYFVSTNDKSMRDDAQGTNAIQGTGVLDTFPYPTIPFEATSERLVHPVYIQADGEFIQLRITMSDDQMMTVVEQVNPDASITYTSPAFEDIQIHSICFFAQKTASRMR